MRKTALWIEYDGQSSQGFGVYQVNFENGQMQSEEIIPSRTVNKVQRQNSSVTDFYSITNSPLVITIDLYLDKPLTEAEKVKVVQWLKKDTYKTLRFETMPDTYYYCVATKIDLSHNTMSKGYFSVSFECNSPYAYTATLISNQYILDTPVELDIDSLSVFDTRIIRIMGTMDADGDFYIKNMNNGTEFYIKGLAEGTNFIFDCFNHETYANDADGNNIVIQDKKQNHSWLQFVPGNNHLHIETNATFRIFWQGIKI